MKKWEKDEKGGGVVVGELYRGSSDRCVKSMASDRSRIRCLLRPMPMFYHILYFVIKMYKEATYTVSLSVKKT